MRLDLTTVGLLVLCGCEVEDAIACDAGPADGFASFENRSGLYVESDPEAVFPSACVRIDGDGSPLVIDFLGQRCEMEPSATGWTPETAFSFGCRHFQWPVTVGELTYDPEHGGRGVGQEPGRALYLRESQFLETGFVLSYGWGKYPKQARSGDPSNDWMVSIDFDEAGCAAVEAAQMSADSGSTFRANVCRLD